MVSLSVVQQPLRCLQKVDRTGVGVPGPAQGAAADEKVKPTSEQIDEWMRQNVKRGAKRDPTIAAAAPDFWTTG